MTPSCESLSRAARAEGTREGEAPIAEKKEERVARGLGRVKNKNGLCSKSSSSSSSHFSMRSS